MDQHKILGGGGDPDMKVQIQRKQSLVAGLGIYLHLRFSHQIFQVSQLLVAGSFCAQGGKFALQKQPGFEKVTN
jgi:hypothetical protein